ncbi:hypothetical protein HK104_007245 [Borealophlyctis nickersoniae]|nr:hypothetical protein HK104_007245 [Borealophlyctis nickersoniae]
MTPTQFKEITKYYLTNIREKEKSSADSVPLKSFSPWLANYHNLDADEAVEIPGQYTGLSKPRLYMHANIASFQPNLLVMKSIRKPKRLVMVGSDEKEYPWLVKGGEDLRLDQRVEQLFEIMNDLMKRNAYCLRNKMSLGTYKVIPMSTSLGILEWVNDTKPLRACMSGIAGFDEENSAAFGKHQALVAASKKNTPGDAYGALFKVKRDQIVGHMGNLYSQITKPYFRMFMEKLSKSPEAFLSIRSEFARSLAALSVCSYLLGIGDRHLENFLVDLKSGRIIAIDFGHAFGSATEVLPVPELIPFRLTKQMILFLEPLGISGLLEYPMINVMTAMQGGKDSLLNAMDIFMKEPLMEWRKFAITQAQKQAQKSKGTQESYDIDQTSLTAPQWYPQQKLDIARRKLEGENPAYLTGQELQWGHEGRKWYPEARKVLMGDASINKRAQAAQKCKDVREQVECLIDQATDPSILGRAKLQHWRPAHSASDDDRQEEEENDASWSADEDDEDDEEFQEASQNLRAGAGDPRRSMGDISAPAEAAARIKLDKKQLKQILAERDATLDAELKDVEEALAMFLDSRFSEAERFLRKKYCRPRCGIVSGDCKSWFGIVGKLRRGAIFDGYAG